MEKDDFVEYCKSCGHKHKTLEEYIAIAKNYGITLTVEDLTEIEKYIKLQEAKCKEKN